MHTNARKHRTPRVMHNRIAVIVVICLVVGFSFAALGGDPEWLLARFAAAGRMQGGDMPVFGGLLLTATAAAYALLTFRSGFGDHDPGRSRAKDARRRKAGERAAFDIRRTWLLSVLVLAQVGTGLLIWLGRGDAVIDLHYAAALLAVAFPVAHVLVRWVQERVAYTIHVLQPGPLRQTARPMSLIELVRSHFSLEPHTEPHAPPQARSRSPLGLPLTMAIVIGLATLLITHAMQLGTSETIVARAKPDNDAWPTRSIAVREAPQPASMREPSRRASIETHFLSADAWAAAD
jgi:hypothetical protein